MPTRCNRDFYCRSYCLLNMFRAPLCPSSGAQEYLICGKKMPSRCNRGFYCRSYCLLNMFRAPLCPSSGAQEYLICGKKMPPRCNKGFYCRSYCLLNMFLLHLVGIFSPHINDDARSKSHQITECVVRTVR